MLITDWPDYVTDEESLQVFAAMLLDAGEVRWDSYLREWASGGDVGFSSCDGTGYGNSYGDGYGYGYGDGYGYGNSYGDGYGDGTGFGSGSGFG